MIRQLQKQHTLDMLHFRVQLLTAICSAKQAHNLLGVGDKVGVTSRWKHVVLREIMDEVSKKLEL